MRAWVACGCVVFLGLTAGCRIQRAGSGDDGLGDLLAAQPRAGAAGERAEQTVTAPPPSAAPSAPAPKDSGAAVSDAGVRSQPSEPDADGGGSAPGTSVAGGGCGSTASIPGCNPITNEGCAGELGMQCDVDLSAPTPSGVCVFSSPSPNPGACLNIPPTESCPAGQTCVGFSTCQKVCLCDADCDAGDCCSEPLAGSGFKTCKAC